MKLHTRISLLLASITIIMICVLAVFFYLRSSELTIYLKSKLKSNQAIVEKVLEFKASSYSQPIRDNAAWDGMYGFTKHRDTTWAPVNMGSTYTTFSFDYYTAKDSSGERLYTIRNEKSKNFQTPADTVLKWFSDKRMLHHFVRTPEGVWEVFGCVIVPTADQQLKSRENGYLISAILWDSAYLELIGKATGFQCRLDTNGKKLTDDYSLEKMLICKELKGNNGSTVATAVFTDTHPFQEELINLRHVIIVLGSLCLLALAIFIILIHRWTAGPLRAINRSLVYGEMESIRHLLKKKQDFGEIARLIKRFKEQTNDLVEEVKARTLADEKFNIIPPPPAIPAAIMESDSRIIQVNEAFCNVSGFTKNELVGKSWMDFVAESDRERMKEYNRNRLQDPSAAPASYIFSYIHKDGSIRQARITVAIIYSTEQVVATIEVLPAS